MRALRFESGCLQVLDVPPPHHDDEALVRVALAGICSTDLHITRGYSGHQGTLGHEFVGVVESSPDTDQIGRRVVGEINAGCGDCELCHGGDSRHCTGRTVLGIHGRDGAFAEYLSLPPTNLLTIPDEISDREAVFAEPLAAACQILDQVTIESADRVAVIGDGKLAQLIVRILSETGCEILLIGRHRRKLALAERGALKAILCEDLDRPAAGRFDYVIEASGSESGLTLAIDLVRPCGTIVLKSTFHGEVSLQAWRIVVDEINVIGSRCGRLARAVNVLMRRRINLEELIDEEFSLEDGVAAMAAAAEPGVLKVLLRP
ncbi:MAG: alcohol dehydrogenase catalytic domain-containing protein [Acidobacteriota bacterium]